MICRDPGTLGVSGTEQLANVPAPDSMHVEVAPNDPAVPENDTVPDGGSAPAPGWGWSVTVTEHVVGTPNPAGLGLHVTVTVVEAFWNSKAPIEQVVWPAPGRGMPRWSTASG